MTDRGLGIFFSSRRRHTRYWRDWSSDVCSSDLLDLHAVAGRQLAVHHVDIHPFRESDGLMSSEAAERALHEAAARLSGLAEKPEHVARIGRGEFLLVQPRAGAEQAAIRAARILNALASVQDAAGRDIASSVGVAVAPEHG